MTESSSADTARRLVLNLLNDTPSPTQDEVRTRVRMVLQMLQGDDPQVSIDENWLVRDVESRLSIWIPSATALEDRRNHLEWYADRKAEIEWRFWQRYRRYIEDAKQWAPETVRRLDEVTDEILKRLEDPRRPGPWDRRGMVVGQVQSGKTSNYTGLIAKAADAGYKLIVVLAGMHNSLRAQTQWRLDEGFLGFDTQQRMDFDKSNVRMGVGQLRGEGFFHVHSLTNSSEKGDFRLAVAKQANVMVGGSDPVLLVVKKNASILENLIKWATLILQQRDPESGRSVVREVPLLVIDDEADNASINTKAIPLDEHGAPISDYDPTRINGRIRKLLNSFEQTAYIGYTATPFANIFIGDFESERFGEELFPRSFIINLPVPSNYLGPVRVFGLDEDPDAALEETVGLPMIRDVRDHEDWIPDKHKKDLVPGPIPASLQEAIKAFVLTVATRLARGHTRDHNSMLIHVTRFTDVQDRVADQVKEELAFLTRRLAYGDGASASQLREELRNLWEQDVLPTTAAFESDAGPRAWANVEGNLLKAASKIQVKQINGTAKDVLEYFEHPNGLSTIAIGGDKLSRGLTLEGLSVSYYLRASKMYDTLMQMGRWFGYRPGYADLCRLYTTPELVEWYRDITAANEELRKEFDHMAAIGATPEDFGLRVRNHPDGLLVTARAKMRNGQTVWVSFSNTISESILFQTAADVRQRNADVTARFLTSIEGESAAVDRRGNRLWRGVRGADVTAFLESFSTHTAATKARSDVLGKYVRARLADDELTDWSVALLSSRSAQAKTGNLGEFDVALFERKAEGTAHDETYAIKRLVSPKDEALDLTDDQLERALRSTQYEWKMNRERFKRVTAPTVPGGPQIREVRTSRQGLLLLYPLNPTPSGVSDDVPYVGFAISFPRSDNAKPVEYVVNNVYWEQEFGVY